MCYRCISVRKLIHEQQIARIITVINNSGKYLAGAGTPSEAFEWPPPLVPLCRCIYVKHHGNQYQSPVLMMQDRLCYFELQIPCTVPVLLIFFPLRGLLPSRPLSALVVPGMWLPLIPAKATLGRAALVAHCCFICTDSQLFKLMYWSSKTSHKTLSIHSDGLSSVTAHCTLGRHVWRSGSASPVDAFLSGRIFWQNQASHTDVSEQI